MIDPKLNYDLWKYEHEERMRKVAIKHAVRETMQSRFEDRRSVVAEQLSLASRTLSILVGLLSPRLGQVENRLPAGSDE